jgi:hypothetical protein
MTDPTPSPLPPAPHHASRLRIAVASAAALLVLAAVGTALLIATSREDTFELHGTITLPYSYRSFTKTFTTDGHRCNGIDSWSDVREGAPVEVAAGDKNAAGFGRLAAGEESSGCVFAFAIKVPAGASSYAVKVGDRDQQRFTSGEARHSVSITVPDW